MSLLKVFLTHLFANTALSIYQKQQQHTDGSMLKRCSLITADILEDKVLVFSGLTEVHNKDSDKTVLVRR